MERFEVVVVGAGMGGVAAANAAHKRGARVGIVEGHRVGGT